MKTKAPAPFKYLQVNDSTKACDISALMTHSTAGEYEVIQIPTSTLHLLRDASAWLTVDLSDVFLVSDDFHLSRLIGAGKVSEAEQKSFLTGYLKSLLGDTDKLSNNSLRSVLTNLTSTTQKPEATRKKGWNKREYTFTPKEKQDVLKLIIQAIKDGKRPVCNRDKPKETEFNIALPHPSVRAEAHGRARAVYNQVIGADLPTLKEWNAMSAQDKENLLKIAQQEALSGV